MNTRNNETCNDRETTNRQSFRLKEYDYSEDGAYFVTICTKEKVRYFDMSPALKNIVQSEWELLPERFPNMSCDAFIVMPNHAHAIIILNDYVGGGA